MPLASFSCDDRGLEDTHCGILNTARAIKALVNSSRSILVSEREHLLNSMTSPTFAGLDRVRQIEWALAQ